MVVAIVMLPIRKIKELARSTNVSGETKIRNFDNGCCWILTRVQKILRLFKQIRLKETNTGND